MRKTKKLSSKLFIIVLTFLALSAFLPGLGAVASAAGTPPTTSTSKYQCGSGPEAVSTTIDFGCNGNSCASTTPDPKFCGSDHSATIDLLFAIIRFLSDGVGLVVIASLIIAGVQYTFSRGEPQAITLATKRIQSSVIALAIFIFAYALINFVIPNGVFGQ